MIHGTASESGNLEAYRYLATCVILVIDVHKIYSKFRNDMRQVSMLKQEFPCGKHINSIATENCKQHTILHSTPYSKLCYQLDQL